MQQSTQGGKRWLELAGKRPLPLLLVILAILPFVNPSQTLSIQILIWGLFAVSYNLLLGYTGLLSFNHATYFGIGSFTAGLLLKHWVPSTPLALLAGVVTGALSAAVVGWFCLRRRGVYFSMLTLAFGQLVYFALFQLDTITGGDDGLRGVPTPSVFGINLTPIQNPLSFYYFCYIVLALALVVQNVIVRSPFGRALEAIRESEERARAVGYNTNAVQLLCLVFAGAFAGLAGALNALYLGYVPIASLGSTTSGPVLMMTVLGGKGSFMGPFLGAAVYRAMEDYFAGLTENWPLLVGGIFVLCVLLLPQGLISLFARLQGLTRSRKMEVTTPER